VRESSTYQAILAEGRLEEARKMLLIMGNDLLGSADAATVAAIESMSDLACLERLIVKALDVSDWAALLQEPGPAKKKQRRPRSS
jgi:hypothetical protein